MKKISATVRLSEAIRLLEEDQAEKGRILKEQFEVTYESIKPVNLIKSTLKEIAASPIIGDNVLGSLMGLASGYLSKKLIVGGSTNIFRKLFGSILQFGVANVVASHPDAIRLIGGNVSKYIKSKRTSKEKKSE